MEWSVSLSMLLSANLLSSAWQARNQANGPPSNLYSVFSRHQVRLTSHLRRTHPTGQPFHAALNERQQSHKGHELWLASPLAKSSVQLNATFLSGTRSCRVNPVCVVHKHRPALNRSTRCEKIDHGSDPINPCRGRSH